MGEGISRALMRGGAMRSAAFFVNIVATLILMPFLIHGLGERSYGMWAMIGTVVAYYNVLDFGLASTNERFMARSFASQDDNEASSVFSTALTLSCLIGLIFAIITAGISFSSPWFFTNDLEIHQFKYTFLILGLNLGLSFPFFTIEGALAARLLYEKIALARITATVFRTATAIAVVGAGHSLIALAFVIFATSMLFRLIIIVLFVRNIPNLKFSLSRFSRANFQEMFHHGKYVFLGNLSSNAHFRLSNIIVGSIAGLAAVTIYTVASRLSEYLQSLVQRVFQMFLPVFTQIEARNTPAAFEKTFWDTFQLNIISTVVAFGLAILFGRYFIEVWLGSGFESSYELFLILSCGLALKQMQITGLQALMAKSRHKHTNLYELAESIAAIALAILLGREYGLKGIATGIVLPMLINKALLQPAVACRDLNLSLRRYYATLLRYSSPTIVAFVLCWLALRKIETPTSWELVLAFLVTFFFTSMVALLSLPGQLRSKILHAVFQFALPGRRSTPPLATAALEPADHTVGSGNLKVDEVVERISCIDNFGKLLGAPTILHDRLYGILALAEFENRVGEPIIIKIIKDPAGISAARTAAASQFTAMNTIHDLLSSTPSFESPRPLEFFEDVPAIVMEWVDAEPLLNEYSKSVFSINRTKFRQAGRWLRYYHEASNPCLTDFDSMHILNTLEQSADSSPLAVTHSVFYRLGRRSLEKAAPQLMGSKVQRSELHGDYQAGNILFKNNLTPCVIDPAAPSRGPSLMDTVTFLGHLDNFTLLPRGLPLLPIRRQLGREFWSGYGTCMDQDPEAVYDYLALAFVLRFAQAHADHEKSILHRIHFRMSVGARIAIRAFKLRLSTRSPGKGRPNGSDDTAEQQTGTRYEQL